MDKHLLKNTDCFLSYYSFRIFFSRTPFSWVKMSYSQSIHVSISYSTSTGLQFKQLISFPGAFVPSNQISSQPLFLKCSGSSLSSPLLSLGRFSISLVTQGSECCTVLQSFTSALDCWIINPLTLVEASHLASYIFLWHLQ